MFSCGKCVFFFDLCMHRWRFHLHSCLSDHQNHWYVRRWENSYVIRKILGIKCLHVHITTHVCSTCCLYQFETTHYKADMCSTTPDVDVEEQRQHNLPLGMETQHQRNSAVSRMLVRLRSDPPLWNIRHLSSYPSVKTLQHSWHLFLSNELPPHIRADGLDNRNSPWFHTLDSWIKLSCREGIHINFKFGLWWLWRSQYQNTKETAVGKRMQEPNGTVYDNFSI